MELDKKGLDRDLICVEYPGIVKNVDKMLETLGGIKDISSVLSGKNTRMELRFRPEDVYCKPTFGDRYKTNGILLKVVIRKKKTSTSEEPTVKSIDILGRTQLAFKFKSICDFQYLPMETGQDGAMKSICGTLLPKTLKGEGLKQWLDEQANYFLPPPAFARVDTMSFNTYMYRKEHMDTVPGPLIGRTRKRRSGHAVFISFFATSVPIKPRDKALEFLKMKFLNGDPLDKIRTCFQERPVWSKLALMCVTKYQNDQMKYLLPAVAYYFTTGPFRIMWVRFGYDPRTDPAARIYQTLDYRIRAPAGLLSLVKAKRSSALMSKSSHPGAKSVVINKELIAAQNAEMSNECNFNDEEYIFFPDRLPPARQMFYQYCDIRVPEIETMMDRLPKLPPWSKCDPRLGWIPPGIDNHCRDILNTYVIKLLKKDMNMVVAEAYKEDDEIDDLSDEGATQWEEEFEDDEVDNESDTGT